MSTTPARARRRHDDAPDTVADFERLAAMPKGPERDALADRLISAWLPMAHRLARRYRNRGENLEDLEQVAALALVKAVDRYDPSYGTPFEPFAIPTIVGELRRHFRDSSWSVHVPRRVQELRNKVRVTIQQMPASATVPQIAEAAGMSEEDVLTGMEALHSFRSLSLDVELAGGDGGATLADTLGTPEGRYDTIVAREAVKPCLRRLPEREQRILYMRFFRDMTQSRIADELGISQMHVSRLITRSCRTIREQVEAEPARLPAAA